MDTDLVDHSPAVASLEGRKICLAGRFLAMTQAEAARLIRARSGRVVQYPSRDTSLVVVGGDGWPCLGDGTPTRAVRRIEELRRSGAPLAVVSENEFFERLGLVEPNNSICRELTLGDLTRILAVTPTRIRRWVRLGLVAPKRTVHRLCFFDLVQVANARRVCALIRCGASLANIRRGLEQIRRWMPERDLPFSQLALLEHDGRLLVRLNGTLAEPNGQLRFDFDGPRELATVAPVRDDVEALFDEALAAEDAGDLAAAADRYRRAISIEPGDPVLHFNLGNVLFAMRRFEEAAESYQRAVGLDAGYAEAWNNLGNTWTALKEWQQAVRAFRRALQLVPDYEDARHNLASMARGRGQG